MSSGEVNNLCMLGFKPEQAKVIGAGYAALTATGASATWALAAQQVTKFSLVSGADGTKGVKIPLVGQLEMVVVKNADNAVLKVYPANSTTDAFNSGSAGASVDIAAYACAIIWRISSTNNICIEVPAA